MTASTHLKGRFETRLRLLSLTAGDHSDTNFSMSCRIWLRLDLPEKEFTSVRDSVTGCELWRRQDKEMSAQHLQQIDAVFTEEPLPDRLTAEMTNLKWLHVTRGGVNAYLTPTVKARPIQVTGSKGIHGTVFSEFALASILALAKKLPECWAAQKQRKWQKLTTEQIAGKTLGIVGLGTVGTVLAQKAKAVGLSVIATKFRRGDLLALNASTDRSSDEPQLFHAVFELLRCYFRKLQRDGRITEKPAGNRF